MTNCRGQGVSAALGLQVIDEAVFALAEKQPGFAKVFFYLEQQVMQPRYEIHSLSMESVVEPVDSSQQQDLAARALFAATEMAHPAKLDTEFGRSLPQERYAEYEQRYRDAFIDQARELAATLTRRLEKQNDIMKAFADITAENDARSQDAWGIPLRIERRLDSAIASTLCAAQARIANSIAQTTSPSISKNAPAASLNQPNRS